MCGSGERESTVATTTTAKWFNLVSNHISHQNNNIADGMYSVLCICCIHDVGTTVHAAANECVDDDDGQEGETLP